MMPLKILAIAAGCMVSKTTCYNGKCAMEDDADP